MADHGRAGSYTATVKFANDIESTRRLHTIGPLNRAEGGTPAHFDFVLARDTVAVARGVDGASQTTASECYTPQGHTPPAYQEAAN